MKTFEQKIKQIKSKRLILAIFVLLIAIIVFILGIIEMIPKEIEYTQFDKYNKSSNYSKTIIYYLMGPLLEVKDTKDETISGYYIAVGENEEMFIIRLNKNNIEIPILGKDINNEQTDTLSGIEVHGNVQLTSSSLRTTFNNRLNMIFDEDIATNASFEKVFGGYHIDTVSKVENNSVKLLILSAFFALIAGLYLLINKKIRANVEQTINQLKLKGKLEEVIKEFESGQLINYKKLKVDLSPNYIFSYNMGLCIIAFKNIKEVKISKKVFGERDKNKYIIITTKDDIEYYIAPYKNRRQKAIFNELLTKIKRTIE